MENKLVRYKHNDLESEQYILLTVVYSPMDGLIGILQRLRDSNFAKTDDLISIPIKDLKVIGGLQENGKKF